MADEMRPWFVCEVHTHGTDSDCEYCERQLTEQQLFLNELRGASQTLDRQISTIVGYPFVATNAGVMQLRIEVLLNMIFTDPKARMAYEINFANNLKNHLGEVHREAVRESLMPQQPIDLSNLRRR